jgi:chaperonin GroEL
MLRQAAEKTGEAVGDGTSTSTILAHAIFADGTRNVVAGASGIDIKRGLDRGLGIAVETLRTMSRPVKTRKEKAQVATISAHNDQSIGELVADAIEKVGDEGVITVEESKTIETSSRWWRACNSIGDLFLLISLPMQRKWRRFWRAPMSYSVTARSAT